MQHETPKEQSAKGPTVGHLSDKDMKGLYLIRPINTPGIHTTQSFKGCANPLVFSINADYQWVVWVRTGFAAIVNKLKKYSLFNNFSRSGGFVIRPH